MKIVCKKNNGKQLTLGWFAPLWVNSITGLGADYIVTTSKNSGQDGETYNGATASKRNITIVLDVKKADYVKQRNRLYNFFQPRSKETQGTQGTLYYYDDPIARKIEYYVESIEPSGKETLKHITISLICPDPKFYALEDSLTSLAVWQGCIEFPLELSEPFEVTKKVNTLIGNVENDSAVPMGLTVKFMASGTAVNPSLYDVNRHELMQINTTMHSGDTIAVTTGDGNKHVTFSSGGVIKNINNLMAYPPVWLKAYQGDNLFRYNADSGIDALSVSILSTKAYRGA